MCLGSGFGCTPPPLAGVLGCVCAGVGALLAPRHSWLGCAPWVCAFGLGFRLRPATPGWGVGVCVCSCACPPCTPPLLAGLCGVGVCVWARVSAAPRHSWRGCLGACVLVSVILLHPASPGWGVRLGCVCLGSGFGCAPPLLAGLLGCVCARVRAPLAPCHSWLGCAVWVCVFGLRFRLRPATPGWVVGLCVCSGARSACTPPLLAGLRGVGVCVWARVSAAPRHSWLGCWAVCVLWCALRLHPATPGTGAWCGCVCLGSGFGCAPPFLARVCVVGVCARARVLAAPRHSWLGFVVSGTCSCAVVGCVLCALSGFVAPSGRLCLAPVRVPWLWPAACLSGVPRGPAWYAAPRPVRSLWVLRSAFPSPWCLSPARGLAPPPLLGGCAGHAEAGLEPGSLCLPLAPAEAGALGSLRVVPVRGPAMGLSLAGPSGVGPGLRALRWLACVDPVTDTSVSPVRPSFDGGLGRCTGAVSCGRRHRPLRVGGRHSRVPRVCACACSSWLGRAGRPPGRVLVRLTFSFGRFGFLLCLAAPFLVFFSFPCPRPRCLSLSLVSGPGCLEPWRCALRSFFPPASRLSVRARFFFFFLLGRWLLLGAWCPPPPLPLCLAGFVAAARCPPPPFFLPACALVVLGFLWFPAPGALGLGAVFCLLGGPPASRLSVRSLLFLCLAWPLIAPWWLPPPPPTAWCSFFFLLFFLRCAPPFSPAFFGFRPRVPWASALGVVCFVGLPLLGCPCVLASFVPPVWPLAAPWWLLPRPPFVPRGFRCFRSPLCAVCCAVLCVPGCGAALRCCALCRPVLSCCVLCCFAALGWCRCSSCRALWCFRRPGALCFAALCFAVVPRAVCVLSLRGGVCCCSPLCFVLCVCLGAVLCVSCPLRSVRCCASLCWCACVVLFVWCVLLLAPGAVVRCRVLCCFLWCAVVRCWVWWPVVVCWCRAVAPCCPFSFAGGVGLCLFPVCAVLCCAARRAVQFRLRLRCCWCLVLLRVPVCCGVSLGVLRCGGAALVCRGLLLCCALSCGVLRPVLCPAVLCCLAVLCWWAVLCGCLRCWCLFLLLSSFPLLNTPAVVPCL